MAAADPTSTTKAENKGLVSTSRDIDPYYLRLAEQYGATIPKGDLVETISRLPRRGRPAPAGTTDAILAEERRDRL
jgi:hypothetical protein